MASSGRLPEAWPGRPRGCVAPRSGAADDVSQAEDGGQQLISAKQQGRAGGGGAGLSTPAACGRVPPSVQGALWGQGQTQQLRHRRVASGISEMPVVWSTGPPASRPFPAVLGWTVTRGRRTPCWPRAPLADKPSSWSQSEAQKPAQPRESGVQPPGPGGVGGVPSPSWLPLDEAPLTPSRASSTCPGLGFESFQTHLPSPAGHPESPKHALAGALGPTKSAFCPLSVRIPPAL